MYLDIITAPCPLDNDKLSNRPRVVFLGGGISGCNNWQSDLIEEIKKWVIVPTVILNPRRDNFDITDKSITEEQIRWEFNALRKAHIITFYFCKETLCPITLFELGGTLERVKSYWEGEPFITNCNILIYIEPGYARAEDVTTQVKLIQEQMSFTENIQVFEKESLFRLALFDLLDI